MPPKRKKKPQSNPARGFATTSLISKTKQERDLESTDASETGSTATGPTSVASDDVKASSTTKLEKPSELRDLSPEKLEEELERSEIQLFVEKHSSTVRKESSRQASRLNTDRRVLRSQAEHLLSSEWLSQDDVTQILELALEEAAPGAYDFSPKPVMKLPSEEDASLRLWTLLNTLTELEFPKEKIDKVLEYVLQTLPADSSATYVWALQEAIDWLALDCGRDQLPDYEQRGKRNPRVSRSPSPDIAVVSSKKASKLTASAQGKGANGQNADTASDDIEVSDLESDLDPDELMAKYLETKARLFEARPDLLEGAGPKDKKRKGGSTTSLGPPSSGVKKLQRKLDKIGSDMLFDKDSADSQWISRRNALAQDIAARKKLNLAATAQPAPQAAQGLDMPEDEPANSVMSAAMEEGLALLDGDDEQDGLGGLFTEPGETLTQSSQDADGRVSSVHVTIRNFGKSTGLSPRRVLEEACRARDPKVKIFFQSISPVTYASRYNLRITWSKDQDTVPGPELSDVDYGLSTRYMTFTMTKVATPDAQQGESYIATVALYLITLSSIKEEKLYQRLPAAWRDLWSELDDIRKDQVNAVDVDTVKELRGIYRHQVELNEADGVILSGFKNRGKSGTSTPTSDGHGKVSVTTNSGHEQHLQDLWSSKSSNPAYQRMLQSRMQLPMYQYRDETLAAIDRNQLVIVCGETGCGKSTQVPAFILERELARGKECKIYCTEPRRISAISLAQRVSEELGERKGDIGTTRSLVGYSIRLESTVAASTRLVYATVGIVLRMLESQEGLKDITHLVVDEVHERSIDTDFLLIVLRELMERRPELRVILMSATVDAQRFSSYFNNAPVLTVPGRTFPVQTRYLEDAIECTGHKVDKDDNLYDGSDTEDVDDRQMTAKDQLQGYSAATRSTLTKYVEYRIDFGLIVKLISKIASSPEFEMYSKAVLVFLPGIAEIRQLHDMLTSHAYFQEGWLLYPLHSTIASEDQQQAFVVPPPGIRKIVMATNIAETGITIPDITAVIDTGMHKEMRFDERRQLSRLVQSFISRANAKQRRGRAGRVQEGLCFHLFTKYRHDQLMAEQQTPEMLRLSLQDLVMRVKICKLGGIEDTLSQALDPPSTKNVRRAIDALVEVDALTSKEELTPLGQQLARLPLDAPLGKLILLSSIFGCLDTALTVAAALSSKSPFLTPFGSRQQADLARLAFRKGDSDLLTLHNAYNSWRKVCTTPGSSENQFCRKNFLSPQNLKDIEDLKGQLLSSLLDANFVQLSDNDLAALNRSRAAASRNRKHVFLPIPASYNTRNDNDTLASTVIAWSFYPKLLTRDGKGWRNISNNAAISLHPTSIARNPTSNPPPTYLSFHSLMQSTSISSKSYYNASSVTPVHPLALLLFAGNDVDFKTYIGVISVDGNRMRFSLDDWKIFISLKVLRIRIREIVARKLKDPKKPLSKRLMVWLDLFLGIVDRKDGKSTGLEGKMADLGISLHK